MPHALVSEEAQLKHEIEEILRGYHTSGTLLSWNFKKVSNINVHSRESSRDQEITSDRECNLTYPRKKQLSDLE